MAGARLTAMSERPAIDRAIDRGRDIDWGRTSADYARYRPGPPPSFFARLAALGVGLPGQRILDLATGTGVLAREFVRRGAAVAGIDIAEEQLAMARHLAAEGGLAIDFRRAPAEATPFADDAFDCITANQCWLYFDKARVIPEIRRLLAPRGLLVTSHFSWLPLLDPVARASEALILKHNPDWTGARYAAEIPAMPRWAEADFRLRAMFWYDEDIAFTRESWRGRIRANRAIGAALGAGEVAAFDAEHDALLRARFGEHFTVRHRLDAHLFEFR
jgi:SAM-dependent methyltransferase